MLVPYELERRAAMPADALLLPGAEAAVAVCAALGHDPPPKLFATADGVLLLLDRPAGRPIAGAIRLRRLSDHLLVPADADLTPQLHPEEAAALTKARG